MSSPDPAFPSIQVDAATEAAQLRDLFFGLGSQVRQFVIDHDVGPTQEQQFLTDADTLEARANSFNAQSIGDVLQPLKPWLENLKAVTADAKKAVATLKKISNVATIATAGVALGAAIASGNVGSILAALTALGQAVQNGNRDEGTQTASHSPGSHA